MFNAAVPPALLTSVRSSHESFWLGPTAERTAIFARASLKGLIFVFFTAAIYYIMHRTFKKILNLQVNMMLFAILVSIVTLCCATQATSPQLSYMHNQLKPLTRKAIRSAKGGSAAVESDCTSVVVATSIEAVYTQGRLQSINNRHLYKRTHALSFTGAESTGPRYALQFQLPVESGHRDIDIQKSELLLFPNVSEPLPPTVRVELIIATTNFNSPVRRLNYWWDTAESCVALDITQFLKSMFRRQPLNGAEIVLRVNVAISRPESRPESTFLQNKSDPSSSGTCAAWLEKKRPPGSSSSTPLIVTKYLTEAQRKDDIASRVSRQSGVENQGCNLTTLFVNVTAIFGDNVIFPTSLNIGNCGGSCEKSDYDNYSLNARAKRKLRALDPSGATLERTYAVHCVPNSFESVTFLVSDKDSIVVMDIPDLVVQSCACL